MVRKTTAIPVDDAQEESSSPFKFDQLIKDARHGAQENSHLLIGVVFLLLALIVLREILFGMVLLTTGILFVSGFFKDKR